MTMASRRGAKQQQDILLSVRQQDAIQGLLHASTSSPSSPSSPPPPDRDSRDEKKFLRNVAAARAELVEGLGFSEEQADGALLSTGTCDLVRARAPTRRMETAIKINNVDVTTLGRFTFVRKRHLASLFRRMGCASGCVSPALTPLTWLSSGSGTLEVPDVGPSGAWFMVDGRGGVLGRGPARAGPPGL